VKPTPSSSSGHGGPEKDLDAVAEFGTSSRVKCRVVDALTAAAAGLPR